MGYYSDVALALTKVGVEALNKKLASIETGTTQQNTYSKFFDGAIKSFLDKESGAKAWLLTGIKWYADDTEYYPEANFVEEFLNSLDEDDYCFLRIGEDIDDIEERGSFFDNPFGMYILRKIVFDQ